MMDIITERLYALTEAMKEDSDYIRYLQLEEELERDKDCLLYTSCIFYSVFKREKVHYTR